MNCSIKHTTTLAVFIVGALLAFFSTAVMTTVALAVPVGPWMHVTIALIAVSLFSCLHIGIESVPLITTVATLGASVATAISFTFPTWYFLDKNAFVALFDHPILFYYSVTACIGLTILWALVLVRFMAIHMKGMENLFPVSQLIVGVVHASTSLTERYRLFWGVFASVIYSSFLKICAIVFSKKNGLYLLSPFIGLQSARLSWVGMFIALGFISGKFLGLPLLYGIGIKYFFVDVCYNYYDFHCTFDNYLFGVCSGIVLYGAMHALIQLFLVARTYTTATKPYRYYRSVISFLSQESLLVSAAVLLTLASGLWLGLTLIQILFFVITSLLCAYQIVLIAARTGLAPVGRFATWVMVPALLCFGITPLIATVSAVCVEVCGMAATDLFFNYIAALKLGVDMKRYRFWQIVAIVFCLVLCGSVLYLIILGHKGLGAGTPLIAQRAYSRALLVQVNYFSWQALSIGLALGAALSFVRVNSALVLAGLLLPIDFSALLLLGAGLRLCFANPDKYESFWSGVFAASALSNSATVLFTLYFN